MEGYTRARLMVARDIDVINSVPANQISITQTAPILHTRHANANPPEHKPSPLAVQASR